MRPGTAGQCSCIVRAALSINPWNKTPGALGQETVAKTQCCAGGLQRWWLHLRMGHDVLGPGHQNPLEGGFEQ